MVSINKEVEHPDNRAFAVWIVDSIKLKTHEHTYTYNIKDLNFNDSLILKGLLVFNNLDCDLIFRLATNTFDNLSKRALAKQIQDLVPKRHY